jgi:uncharacterized membrane protein (UPF0127 family)
MQIVNTTRNTLLAEKAVLADSFMKRLVGLLDRDHLSEGEGIVLSPSNSIHSFFMRFVFDAVFIDRDNTVVACIPDFQPSRISPIYYNARITIELPAGTIVKTKTVKGDKIVIR